jgi:hypothetical protein
MVVDASTLQWQDCPSVARFAEQVLERMEEEANVNPLALPTTVTYNSIINAWAKSGLQEGREKPKHYSDEWRKLG